MIFPEITVGASKAAIRIWMNAVVPSLLPFMIGAGCIRMTGAKTAAESKYYPVLMAFLSGYPMGAKLAAEYYKAGLTNESGLKRLLCYAMITGPAFLVGGVGVSFYKTKTAGYILVGSHYAAALCCGLLLNKRRDIAVRVSAKPASCRNTWSETPFTDCILESFKTLVIILAYILLFMIAAEFMEYTGVFQGFSELTGAFCKGLLEMTVGCSAIASCDCRLQTKLILSSYIISFGGLSVIGQTVSMLEGCPVTLWEILKIKMFHGLFSAIWTFILCTFVIS